jgi:hypothetical protein
LHSAVIKTALSFHERCIRISVIFTCDLCCSACRVALFTAGDSAVVTLWRVYCIPNGMCSSALRICNDITFYNKNAAHHSKNAVLYNTPALTAKLSVLYRRYGTVSTGTGAGVINYTGAVTPALSRTAVYICIIYIGYTADHRCRCRVAVAAWRGVLYPHGYGFVIIGRAAGTGTSSTVHCTAYKNSSTLQLQAAQPQKRTTWGKPMGAWARHRGGRGQKFSKTHFPTEIWEGGGVSGLGT